MVLYYLLIAITPFLTPPLLSRFTGNVSPFRLLGAVCALYVIIEVLRQGSFPAFFRTRQAWLFAALFVLAAVSFFTRGLGHFFQDSVLLIYFDLWIFFFVTVALVSSVARLRWTLYAVMAGIAWGSIDTIREWREFSSVADYRAGGAVGDGNYFATCAALILPVAFLLLLHSKGWWKKLLLAAWLVLSFVAVTLTGSRGGALAISAAFIYVICHSRHRARNLVLFCALAVPLAIYVPVSPVHRFLHPGKWDNYSKQARLDLWKAGLGMFESHPLAGVGLGNFRALVPRYSGRAEVDGIQIDYMAHNTYIEYLAELGILGPVIFLAACFYAYRSLRRVRRYTRAPGRPQFLYVAALGLEAGLVGFLVGAFFLSGEYYKLFWVVMFLSMCMPRLTRRRLVLEAEPVEVELADAPALARIES